MDKLADEIRFGLEEALPGMRKTILKKLPLAVAAMIRARTPNTLELSARLLLDTKRADMHEQWLRRLLTNRLISSAEGGEKGRKSDLIELIGLISCARPATKK